MNEHIKNCHAILLGLESLCIAAGVDLVDGRLAQVDHNTLTQYLDCKT